MNFQSTMFRNSAWILCAFLLCFGNFCLGENEQHEETPIGSSLKADPNAHLDDKSSVKANEQTPKVEATDGTSSHTDKDHSSTTTESPVSPTKPQPQPTKKPAEPTAKPTEPTAKPTEPTAKPTEPPTKSPTTPPSSSAHTSTSTSPSTPLPSSTTPVIPVTPTPGPHKGSWNVTDSKTNVTCIRIDGIFSIDYTYAANKTYEPKVHLDVPQFANATGSCEGKIKLQWTNVSHVNSLEFVFKKNESKKVENTYVLASFSGYIFIPSLNKTKNFNSNNNVTHFETPINKSYSCSAMKQIKVDDHTKVTLDDFHLQAFKISNTTNFDASVDCAGSTPGGTPDIVPIVVGCVLALLVIAVLVAYLISRRRSATRGYLSM